MASPRSINTPLSTADSFACGGLAACIAVTFSNPAEVAKTRLQLQGQLGNEGGEKIYKNVLDVFSKTVKTEGIWGMQRGLYPAYAYTVLLNGSKLGFYEPFRRSLNQLMKRPADEQIPFTSIAAGASAGAVGAVLGNPLFLIKARMQAYSPIFSSVTQHHYKNSFDALSTIFRGEGGVRGLFRGVDAAILRTAIGSSVQLPSYNFVKNQLVQRGILPANSPWTFLVSSSVSGACVCLVMQPADTALTRMYNQPTTIGPDGRSIGVLYKNVLDCLGKTVKSEGISGLYKGSTAHFLRIAPHIIITLTSYDIIIGLYRAAKNRRNMEW